jgi:hypothetical protein
MLRSGLILIVPAAPPALYDRDSEHLRLLAIFHYILGAMSAFFACFPIIHLIMGIVMVASPAFMADHSNNAPPTFVGWFFITIAVLAISIGWIYAIVVILAGRFIASRINYTFCFVVACIECVFLPMGTVLGVFTLLVLTRPAAKAKFRGHG